MLLVLGGIYTGLVTPNEAGGLGVFGALVIAVADASADRGGVVAVDRADAAPDGGHHRDLHVRDRLQPLHRDQRADPATRRLVIGLKLGKYQLIGAILLFYVLIGMFMNALPALVLTVPLFFPVAMGAGFDPIWFGVIVVIMVELGVVTPPIGVNVFAIATMAKDVSMDDVFRGVLPFWIAYRGRSSG